jgi:hypothetical protein
MTKAMLNDIIFKKPLLEKKKKKNQMWKETID